MNLFVDKSIQAYFWIAKIYNERIAYKIKADIRGATCIWKRKSCDCH